MTTLEKAPVYYTNGERKRPNLDEPLELVPVHTPLTEAQLLFRTTELTKGLRDPMYYLPLAASEVKAKELLAELKNKQQNMFHGYAVGVDQSLYLSYAGKGSKRLVAPKDLRDAFHQIDAIQRSTSVELVQSMTVADLTNPDVLKTAGKRVFLKINPAINTDDLYAFTAQHKEDVLRCAGSLVLTPETVRIYLPSNDDRLYSITSFFQTRDGNFEEIAVGSYKISALQDPENPVFLISNGFDKSLFESLSLAVENELSGRKRDDA